MEAYVIGFLIGFVVAAIIVLSSGMCKIYFNSRVKDIFDQNFSPVFEITNIETSTDGEHNKIAKYTIINCFFAKKKNIDFKYQTFYFYDKIGKYNVGDKLILIREGE